MARSALAIALAGASQLGWIAYMWLLVSRLSAQGAGPVLFCFAAAALWANLGAAGVGHRGAEKLRAAWAQECFFVLLRWAMIGVASVLVVWSFPLQFFQGDLPAVATLVGLSLALTLMQSVCALRSNTAGAVCRAGRIAVVIALTLVVDTRFGLDARAALGVHLLGTLLVLAFSVCRLPVPTASPASMRFPSRPAALFQSGSALFRGADILAIGWILPAEEVAIYLAARGVAAPIGLALSVLRQAMLPRLAAAFRDGPPMAYAALAARANLGVLLIGGAAVVAVLAAGPWVVGSINSLPATAQAALYWTALGQGVPVLFGATDSLMRSARLGAVGTAFEWAFSALAVFVLLAYANGDAVAAAIVFALVRAGNAALCAGMLALWHGVWPGATALLHRQIRLL